MMGQAIRCSSGGLGRDKRLVFVVTGTHGLRNIQTAGVHWSSDRRGSLTTAPEPLGVDVNGEDGWRLQIDALSLRQH